MTLIIITLTVLWGAAATAAAAWYWHDAAAVRRDIALLERELRLTSRIVAQLRNQRDRAAMLLQEVRDADRSA